MMDGTVDFSRIRTYPIRERRNKFRLADMLALDTPATWRGEGDLDGLAEGVLAAKAAGRPVIAMLGGAVIKEGCSDLLIDLLERGFIQHVAGNGAVSIHDFELALIGETSEDVPDGLRDGTFGMAEETGAMINAALRDGAEQGLGYGEAVGRMVEAENLPHRRHSLLCRAVSRGVPVTIHVAVGGDIIHQHPRCDGAALGATSFEDFRRLTATVTQLAGGVVLNIGSAVLMPEVFLKALTIARNLGHDVRDFTTANLDFLDQYRPRTRVVQWPSVLGCRGYDIRGRHAETLPALYRRLVDG
jgi:hypothetical protein